MIPINPEDLKNLLLIAQRYCNAFETMTSQGMRADQEAKDFYQKAKQLLVTYQQ
jgi:hypothetical protein